MSNSGKLFDSKEEKRAPNDYIQEYSDVIQDRFSNPDGPLTMQMIGNAISINFVPLDEIKIARQEAQESGQIDFNSLPKIELRLHINARSGELQYDNQNRTYEKFKQAYPKESAYLVAAQAFIQVAAEINKSPWVAESKYGIKTKK